MNVCLLSHQCGFKAILHCRGLRGFFEGGEVEVVAQSSRIRLHRRQFVSTRIVEMEAAAAGETNDRFGDRRTGRAHDMAGALTNQPRPWL